MDNYNNIRIKNQERILQHIGFIVFKRNLTVGEIKKAQLLFDIGKSLPEIISAFRSENDRDKEIEYVPKCSSVSSTSPRTQSEQSFLRTPLELYFHKYVSS